MFIEWIANEVKKEYIEQYIKAYNKGKVGGEKLRDMDIFDMTNAYNIEGFEELIRNLEFDNAYVRFYNSMVFDGRRQRLVQDCLVFCFGDVSCDVHKFAYTNKNLKELPYAIFEDLKQNAYKFTYHSDMINPIYSKKFIWPNLLPQQKVDYVRHVRDLQNQEKIELNKKLDKQWESIFGK